jgi:hypothetical protein
LLERVRTATNDAAVGVGVGVGGRSARQAGADGKYAG